MMLIKPALLTLVLGIAVATLANARYEGLQEGRFMRSWRVLGPIPLKVEKDKNGEVVEESEKGCFRSDSFSPAEIPEVVSVDETDYRWVEVESDTDEINLTNIFGQHEYVVAYAVAEVEASEEEPILLGLGSDDAVKVWLNGELVHENWVKRGVMKDADLIPVTLKKGKNILLVKVQNSRMGWGFICRRLGSAELSDRYFQAAWLGNLDDLRMLLDHGVDPNIEQGPGLNAVHIARIAGRKDAVELLISKGVADTPVPPETEIIDWLVGRAIGDDQPGVAVLASRDGKIIYERGFGMADLEHKIPITPDTKFRIGSITKQFTAAAILKLQEEGKLSVSDKLSKYIPDFPRSDEITLHHLLTHTSGMHSYTDDPDFMSKVTSETMPEEIIENLKDDEFHFSPGDQWRYCNSGYMILGYIVARVSGMELGEYLNRTFFDPLGMNDTGIYRNGQELENEAIGYSYKGKIEKALNWNMSWAGGAGALYSTVRDLMKWNEAVFGGKVLSEESMKAAFTPVTLNNGQIAQTGFDGYGYGWGILKLRGLTEVSHGGGLNGFSSYLMRIPEKNLTVAVLGNCLPTMPDVVPSQIARQIAEILLWKELEQQESMSVDETVDTSRYEDYVGRYDYGYGQLLTVTTEDGRLFAQMSGQPRYEIFPKGDETFFWKVVDAQVKFLRDENGNVTGLIHTQSGMRIEAPKVQDEKEVAVDTAIYDDYVGEYRMPNGMTLKITREGDRLFAQIVGQPRLQIHPKGNDTFFWKEVKASITFIRDENGKVIGAEIDQAGTKVGFTKK